MALDREAAEEAIKTQIAEPLGVSTVEAAALIRRIIDDKMASAIRKEVTLRGYRPTDFTLFAFGGGGPTHVAGYMGEIPRAVMFPFSPVFCAYGSSIMDVVHLYERSHRMMLLAPLTGAPAVDRDAFNALVARADGRGQARGRGRGAELGRRDRVASSSTASTAARSTPSGRRRRCCSSSPRTTSRAVYERFEQEFSEAFSPLAVNVPGGVYIDTFVLRVAVPGPGARRCPSWRSPTSDADAREHAAGVLRRRLGGHAGLRVRGAAARATASPARRSSRPPTRPRSSRRAGGSRIEKHGLGILEEH